MKTIETMETLVAEKDETGKKSVTNTLLSKASSFLATRASIASIAFIYVAQHST